MTNSRDDHDGAGEPVVALLNEQFAAAVALAQEVPDDQWSTPTDLPGWTVQDCFSHMIGVERQMMGVAEETPPLDHLPHVRDDFGRMVEAPVELRRSRTPAEIRSELSETLATRQAELEGYPPDKFDEDSWTPAGPGSYRDFMLIRVFDLWMHEQDVRHALGLPGHLDGPVVESVLAVNATGALPMIIGKRAGAPGGAVVEVEVVGETEARFVVQVREVDGKRRAALVDADAVGEPTAHIRINVDPFMRLCGGRVEAAAVLDVEEPQVVLSGDRELARTVVENLTFTP
ncbi:MAG: maleylpyruvate isomerase family mycothiol-dependent enzyme [Microthrixaceae bacterium]